MGTMSTLMALLALDNNAFLQGIASSQKASDGFVNNLANMGGAVVMGGLTVAATAIATVGAAAWDASGRIDEAMDTIASATGASGPELETLRDDFEKVFTSVPTDARTAADVIGILNSRLDTTGPSLQGLAEPLLNVSRLLGTDASTNAELFTRVMGDWSIPVEEGAGSLDALFVAAQETGAPLDTLMQQIVQYGAPLRNFGFGFEESGALLASFAAQGVNTETVMGGLRSAQNTFIGQGKDMTTGLWETIDAISNASNRTDALAIASKVFGRGAADWVDTVRAGKFDLNELTGAMQNADGAISATADATSDWGEMWQIFKNKADVALAPIGDTMREGVSKALDSVIAIFERPDVQTSLTKFTTMIGTFITSAVAYIPILIDGFFKFVEFLKNNEGIVIGVLVALGVAALAWGITSAIAAVTAMAPLIPVIAVILLIAAAAYLLYQAWVTNFGGIQDKVQTVMSFIEDLTSGKLGAISELWQNFTQGLQIWWETTTTNLKLILQAFGQLFAGDWTALGETLQMIWDNTWQGIQGILSLAWENTKIIFTGMINGIINFFTQTDWGAVGRGILQGIVNGFNAYISWATGNMKSGINAILSAVKGFLGIRSPSKVFEMQVGYQMASGAALGWERGLDKLFSFQGLQPAAIDVPSRDLRVAAETGASSGNRNDNSASNDELARTIREHLNKHALSQAIVEALVQRGIGSR